MPYVFRVDIQADAFEPDDVDSGVVQILRLVADKIEERGELNRLPETFLDDQGKIHFATTEWVFDKSLQDMLENMSPENVRALAKALEVEKARRES